MSTALHSSTIKTYFHVSQWKKKVLFFFFNFDYAEFNFVTSPFNPLAFNVLIHQKSLCFSFHTCLNTSLENSCGSGDR